ncbi:MAG: TonB-dependent receptor [Deltaproteobacteria bacterium]|jgi:outer membrane receptor for ferrienterochelin and colicin/thioredoxin-like negative regulator of GroEL|nr:TonB-dependent receptor [Deltaproteobacteria bacterium]
MRFLLSLALVLVLSTLTTRWAHADSKADARRYFQQGMAALEAGRYREGIDLLTKAYEIRPHRNVLFNIGRAYASLGELDQATDYFERYLATDPPDAAKVRSTMAELEERRRLRNLVDQGMAAIRAQRHLEGAALLQRAYDERPHPNILFNLARAYEDGGDSARALASYRLYLESRPKDSSRVEARIAALEGKKRDDRVARVEPPRRRASPPPPPPPPPPKKRGKDRDSEDPPPPANGVSEEQLEKLAELIIGRLKQEGALSSPPPPVEEPPPPPPPATVVVETTPLAEVPTSTAVTLEAKGGEVYDEVVITASRRAQSPIDAPNAVTILTEEDIRLSGARTLPDLLRRVPGMDVMAMSYTDYNVAMRGFNRRIANKILVLIDGRTAYADFLGGTQWRTFTIDLLDIERVEVVRGPGSAIYGAYAYTGIINIITKRPADIRGSTAQLGGGNGRRVDSAYQYGMNKGPVGVRVSAGFERADKYELEFDPQRVDYTTNVADPEKSLEVARFDGQAEYNFSDTSRAYLGAGARSGFSEFYGVASLRNQATDGQEYNVRGGVDTDLVSLRAFWNRQRLTSTPEFYRVGTDDLGSTVRFDLVSVEPVFRPELELFGTHSIVVGGEFRHKFIDWDYLSGPQTENHFALFFQDSWKLNETISLLVSGRLDLHPIVGPLGSPRAAVIWKPAPRQALRLSIGTAFRTPTMAETYLDLAISSPQPGVAVTLIGGQSGLDPEAITTFDLGYRFDADFGELEAVVYLNRVSDLISRTPLQATGIEQVFRPDLGAYVAANSFYINDPRVFLALGGELSARVYPIDGVDLGGSYAAQYIFDQDSGDRFTDSPIHKLTFWGQLRTRVGLDLGLSVHFTSSQRWVEPDYDPNSATGFDAEPLPLPSSVLVMGRIGYRLLDDQLEVAVSGTNLLDFGDLRHREHPYGNQLEARLLGQVTARF